MRIANLALGAVLLVASSAIDRANAQTCPPPFTRDVGLQPEAQTALGNAIGQLRLHAMAGPSAPLLTQAEIIAATNDFVANAHQLTATYELLSAALALVDEYEANGYGPVFLNTWTKYSNKAYFSRVQGTSDGKELDRAMMIVMQAVLDEVYHASLWGNPETGEKNFGSDMLDWTYKPIVKDCQDLLRGRKWMAAKYVPGMVDPPADGTIVHNVMVNASYKNNWGRPTTFSNLKRGIRPIGGLYLAPGEIASITVPPALVGQGFHIQIGSNMIDCSRKDDRYLRQDRMTTSVPIDEETTYAANPYGGELYLRAPYGSEHEAVEVQVSGGVVQSASFFMTSVKNTTQEEWDYLRANAAAPWVSIETDNYLKSWYADGVKDMTFALMSERANKYVEVFNAVSTIQGIPPEKRNTYVLFEGLKTNSCSRASVNSVGFPQALVNIGGSVNGLVPLRYDFYVRDPVLGWGRCCGSKPIPFEHDPEGDEVDSHYIEFHELGHTAKYRYSAYPLEKESIVHVGLTYARNKVYGDDLDTSYMFSQKGLQNPQTWAPRFTLDRAAIDWMVRDNFRLGFPAAKEETAYQHRGHAKYVEIAKLTGSWEYLEQFYLEEHQRWENEGLGNAEDYFDKISSTSWFPENPELADKSIDSRTLRLSVQAGQDLTPLIHFWGVHPENYSLLKEMMVARNLHPSQEVKDLLLRYVSLVPQSPAEYDAFYLDLWVPSITKKCNGDCFFHQERAPLWNNTTAAEVQAAVMNIIEMYWPSSEATARLRLRRAESPIPATPSEVESTIESQAATAAHEYMVALNKWISLGPPQNYVYHLERDFFGPKELEGPFEVVVEGGSVSVATYEETGEDADESEILSIEGLFDLIARSMDKNDFVHARYDEESGYPSEIRIVAADEIDEDDNDLDYDNFYVSDVRLTDERVN